MGRRSTACKLIIALDSTDLFLNSRLTQTLDNQWFKVGKTLFTLTGPASVKYLSKNGKRVFLDLKYHDIPKTVSAAVAAATKIGANMISVHTASGFEALYTATETATETAHTRNIPTPLLVGVTTLTSITEHQFQHHYHTNRTLRDQVLYESELAETAGLNGIICSPQETQSVRTVSRNDFLIINPGIRWTNPNDQKRTGTPREAAQSGADYIIIGRPIHEAKHPKKVVESIEKDLAPSPVRVL